MRLVIDASGPRGLAAYPHLAMSGEHEVVLEWQLGDVILDLYEVREVVRSGGMGLVYRVLHRGWNVELAVKVPRRELVAHRAVHGTSRTGRVSEARCSLPLIVIVAIGTRPACPHASARKRGGLPMRGVQHRTVRRISGRRGPRRRPPLDAAEQVAEPKSMVPVQTTPRSGDRSAPRCRWPRCSGLHSSGGQRTRTGPSRGVANAAPLYACSGASRRSDRHGPERGGATVSGPDSQRVRSVRSRLAVVIDEALGGLPEIAIKSASELERALERSW